MTDIAFRSQITTCGAMRAFPFEIETQVLSVDCPSEVLYANNVVPMHNFGGFWLAGIMIAQPGYTERPESNPTNITS